jgi:recombination protein RecA
MTERQRQIVSMLSQMDKQFGKGSVVMLGNDTVQNVSVISSGSIGIDYALGVGGFPRGRVIEIFGPESSGKTTLALHVIAEAQRLGGAAAFVDAEHALDPVYARGIGVDLDNLIVSQPDLRRTGSGDRAGAARVSNTRCCCGRLSRCPHS